MQEKITGYILLVVGIFIIVFAGVAVLSVFTKKSEPIQFIDQQATVGLNLSLPGEVPGQNMKVPVQLNQLQPMLRVINSFIYLVLMSFIASVGYKIAMIGVNLIRPIVIKAK